jgi:hypothetical protein
MRFPRPGLEAEFDSVMTGGAGATLFGLRRIGKSSEAMACAERLEALPQCVICEDAQGMTSEAQLLFSILKKLPPQGIGKLILERICSDDGITKTVKAMLGSRAKIELKSVEDYFGPIVAAIERSILSVPSSERIVLIIDELPWLCRGILEGEPQRGASRVDLLLAVLRRWRVAGMRMLLLGSIGLKGLGREHRLDLTHLNDLTPLSVPPFEVHEAAAFVNALAAGGGVQGWTEGHTHALLGESAAFYPSMLQRAFQQVTIGRMAAEVSRFPEIFAVKVRPDLDANFYQQFDRRRKLYKKLPEPLPRLLEKLCKAVLSSSGGALPFDELQNLAGSETDDADLGEALGILREDGFLDVRVERDGSQHWRVASSLVAAWWKRRKGGARQ